MQNRILFPCIFLQTVVQQISIVQKFGNTRMTPSTLGGHEGKYTPSSSVPDLAQRYVCVCRHTQRVKRIPTQALCSVIPCTKYAANVKQQMSDV
jgi:hypothetical protein